MDYQNQIIDFLKGTNRFYSFWDLQKFFPKITDLKMVLTDLEKKGKIYCENNQYIYMPHDAFLKFGILQISNRKNYYIVTQDNIKILIKQNEVKKTQAKVGDAVFVELVSVEYSKRQCNYGKIKRVVQSLERDSTYLVKAKIMRKSLHGNYYVLFRGKEVLLDSMQLHGAFVGDIVNLRIHETEYAVEAEVQEVLQKKEEKKIFIYRDHQWHSLENFNYVGVLKEPIAFNENDQILATYNFDCTENVFNIYFVKKISRDLKEWIAQEAIDYNFSFTFSDEIKKEIYLLPESINHSKRVDLRNLLTITIDPPYAKDLDDAISIEKNSKGYRLYVHIADVDYYVPFNSSLFKEAIKRGNSCYPSKYVLPQLPEELSNGLCSLNESEDRLTKTMMIDVDFNGKITDYQIFHSVIRNDKKMSYDKVNLLLENNYVDPEYLPFHDCLFKMNELSSILQTRKMERGYLYFYNSEMRVLVDSDGKPIRLSEEPHGTAQQIIENFMLLANEATTEYAYWLQIPFVYRNHLPPSTVKLARLKDRIQKCYGKIQRIYRLKNQKNFQKYLLTVYKNASLEERKYITQVFLCGLEKAYYSEQCEGHFGLALERYGTVTSPIRKGSDLINHVVLGELLNNGIDTTLMDKIHKYIPTVVNHLTNQEIAADPLEEHVNEYLLEQYLMQYVNYKFNAVVEFITEDQIYFQTDNNICGSVLVPKGSYLDKMRHILYINDTMLRIGSPITVYVRMENTEKAGILFELLDSNYKLLKK